MCDGRDPFSGERIVAPRLVRDKKSGELVEMHRAGNDCTYSAPKSVSVLYAAGDRGVKEAHDAAVVAVLRHQEGETMGPGFQSLTLPHSKLEEVEG